MGLIRSPAAGLKQLAAQLDGEKDMSLVSSKFKQMESRIVEEVYNSDKEMDVE